MTPFVQAFGISILIFGGTMADAYQPYSTYSYQPALAPVQSGAPVYTQQQASYTPPGNYNLPKPPSGYTTSTGQVLGPTPAPSSGGSSGGSSGSGLDPHINPATGAWDDNYFASQQPKVENPDMAAITEAYNAMKNTMEQYKGTLGEVLWTGTGLCKKHTFQFPL